MSRYETKFRFIFLLIYSSDECAVVLVVTRGALREVLNNRRGRQPL